MEIGQLPLIRTNGKRFDLYLVWLKDTEALDCSCPRAAAVALRETPSLRLTFSLVHWNSQPHSLYVESAPTFPYADPKSFLRNS